MTGRDEQSRDHRDAVIARLSAAWGFELLPEVPGHGPVVQARSRDGADVVLKLGLPSARLVQVALALRAWNGRGAPELFRFDAERGALLLERVRPGTTAVDATAAEAARLLATLRVDPPAGLPDLDGVVGARIDAAAHTGSASGPRLAWARTALERLGQGGRAVLVHGALDERNLLRCDRRGLCAVDPRPCAGDAAYDAACWIHANGRAGRRARFEALAAELELDRERLRDWCGVVAVHG